MRTVLWAILLGLPITLTAAETPQNTLTPEEAASGWILLFDGQTTYGWQAEDAQNQKDWYAQDGYLTCNTKAGFNHIKHQSVFADFHLKLEFWVNKKGNSGVFFRGALGKDRFVGKNLLGGNKVSGYEAQVDDNDARGLLYQTGGLYDVAPAAKLIRGEEEWRSYDIIAEGDHIITKINGQTMVDTQKSMFSIGHIGLQHHNPGSIIRYRNIKLKPLGEKSLFNGKDLSGWKVIDRAGDRPNTLKQSWTARDGLLHVEVPKIPGARPGGQGQIETEAVFANFVLQLDGRTNGRWLNSGVFFRTLPGQAWIGYEAQIRNQWIGDDRTKPFDYGTGGLYNLLRARQVVSNDKEFFKMTVAAYDKHIAIWVNGFQTVDFSDNRANTGNPRTGFSDKAGTIALQSHDPTTNLDFKNIEIADLSAAKPASAP